jgi:autotransporter-associated beta strand protein
LTLGASFLSPSSVPQHAPSNETSSAVNLAVPHTSVLTELGRIIHSGPMTNKCNGLTFITRRIRLSSIFLFGLILAFFDSAGYAENATWNLNPVSGDWNTATNWTPNTVPGVEDIATFNTSAITGIAFSHDSGVLELLFNPGASAFTFTVDNSYSFSLNFTGVVNNSGVTQNFAVSGPFTALIFNAGASAGSQTMFTTQNAGGIIFNKATTAGEGVFVNEGGVSDVSGGGYTLFGNQATAGNATIICQGGQAAGAWGGRVIFDHTSNAGTATLIADGGVLGGGHGGTISFEGSSTGDTARVELFANGQLSVGAHGPKLAVGSIEGDGVFVLGTNGVLVGTSGLSTSFSGVIRQNSDHPGGPLGKTGTGAWTLAGGSNTYTGGTTVYQGTLIVTNTSGSATGTGAVSVSAGTLGGSGIITGAVTVGTGSGTGAFLAPAHGGSTPLTLTIRSSLTFNSDSTYTYTFNASGSRSKNDKVVANGVTINNGATLNLSGTAQGTLTQGTVLTVIKNTAATPISGTFSNLPNGAIVTVNGNNLQASYNGGDGNDLTLTVVP